MNILACVFIFACVAQCSFRSNQFTEGAHLYRVLPSPYNLCNSRHVNVNVKFSVVMTFVAASYNFGKHFFFPWQLLAFADEVL